MALNKISGIYKITNNINNKCYIGQSKNIKRRFSDHKSEGYRKFHADKRLYRSFEKYGLENFTFEIIETCETCNLDEREIYWIQYYDSYNNGYNDTKGGQGCRGKHRWYYEGVAYKNKIIKLICKKCGEKCEYDPDVGFIEVACWCPFDERIQNMNGEEIEKYYDGYTTMTQDFCDGYDNFESWAECNLI